MGLRINNNVAATNAYRNLSITDGQMTKSLEKLSSGFRINRAADDAAGLSISEGLRAQTGGLKVAVRNAQDGISVVQTAEGALTETHSILQRMRDLAVQSSSSGSLDDKAKGAAQTEFDQLNKELDRIGSTTAFGKTKLLDGTYGIQGAKATAAAIPAASFPSALTLGTPAAGAVAASGATTMVFSSSATTATTTVTMNNTLAALGNPTGTPPIANKLTADGAGAAALQAALQKDLDAGASSVAGVSTRGTLKATVSFDPTAATMTVSIARNDGTTNDLSIADSAGFGLTAATTTAATSTGTAASFQVGANNTTSDKIAISVGAVDSTSLNTKGVDLTNQAAAAIDTIDAAISTVSDTRANLGAYQNRFEHAINNLNVAVENTSASESRIRDTDMAQEMVQFTRSQILSQAGTSMLAQANQSSQSVLKLLG
jgi:flagellin